MANRFQAIGAALFALALTMSTVAAAADVTVTITGARSDDGIVLLSLHNEKKGFPGENALVEKKAELEDGKAKIVFKDVESGAYAIALIHDEDGNGKLKTNFIGIPKEGIGTSNNVKPRFGPPSYEKASFEVGEEPVELEIVVLYL